MEITLEYLRNRLEELKGKESMRDISKRAGLNIQAVRDILKREDRKSLDVIDLAKILDAFDIRWSEFFQEGPDPLLVQSVESLQRELTKHLKVLGGAGLPLPQDVLSSFVSVSEAAINTYRALQSAAHPRTVEHGQDAARARRRVLRKNS